MLTALRLYRMVHALAPADIELGRGTLPKLDYPANRASLQPPVRKHFKGRFHRTGQSTATRGKTVQVLKRSGYVAQSTSHM